MHQKKLQGTLIFKTFMACCLRTRLESPKGFWETAIVHFNFQSNEMEDMLYLSNPAGVEIFSHVNTFVGFMLHILCCCRNLGQQNEKYTFQNQHWFCSKLEKQDGTPRIQTTAFCWYKKLYAFGQEMFARFLNANMEMTSFVPEECFGGPN